MGREEEMREVEEVGSRREGGRIRRKGGRIRRKGGRIRRKGGRKRGLERRRGKRGQE